MDYTDFYNKIMHCPPDVLESFCLRRYEPLRKDGEILLDSEKVIKRALHHNIPLLSILGTQTHLAKHRDWIRSLKNCKIYVGSEREIAETTGHRLHQGMIARARKPINRNLPELGHNILCLNGVLDAQNIGVIARSCLAFGLNSLLVDEKSCSPYTRRSIRVSMGSIFPLLIRETPCLLEDILMLKQQSYKIMSLELASDANSIDHFPFPQRCMLIVGNEDQGVSREISDLCDTKIKIPMTHGIDSLNVAQASSIALYIWQQQRTSQGTY